MRTQKPLVHCVTNQVAMNFTANTLYALGASPLMSHAPEEAVELARLRGNLLVNIGTLTAPWLEDVRRIVAAETGTNRRGGRRAVLDPVGAGATRWRTDTATELLRTGAFRVLRGNAFEIMSLAGQSARGQGVESFEDPAMARAAARDLARRFDLIVAVSGAVDLVTDGERELSLENGHPDFARVTGAGCALNAVIAAMLGVADTVGAVGDARASNDFDAVAAGLAVFNIAGEKAAERSSGPGSFALNFLDELAGLDDEDLRARLRLHGQSTPLCANDGIAPTRANKGDAR